MLAWGEFYVLLPVREVAAAASNVTEEDGIGQYPDVLWSHHGRESLEKFHGQLRSSHADGRLTQFGGCWGWTRCRIATSGGTFTMSLPGLQKPMEVPAELVFHGEDFRKELDRRAGSPPPMVPTEDAPEAGWANGSAFRHHALRRDLASMEMVLEILGGSPPVHTLEDARIRRRLRDRERREVDHVTGQPTVLAEMLKWAKNPRKNAKRGSEIVPADRVDAHVLPNSTVRLSARLAPDCRTMLHGKPKASRVPRLTGIVSQPALSWEERTFDISENPSALQLAQGLLEMCAAIDLDFHRSAAAVAAEILQHGRSTGSIEGLHRLRGGEGKCGQQDRARYSRHLEIMRRLEMEVDMPDGRGILVIPFAAGGARILNRETRAVQAQAFHAIPDSIVGMMQIDGGHRWQYWLDTRVLRLEDDLAYSLHHVLARQWAARMTQNAVQGESRHAWNLDSVLDRTSMREMWRKRMAKQGKPWLQKRVEDALAALNRIGLFGAGGSARVEWNPEDIASSKVLFGEPPPHILEAHTDRNSRRIEGARKKRLRLDTKGNAPRVGKGKPPGRKGRIPG